MKPLNIITSQSSATNTKVSRGFKTIDLFHHIMYIYGKITETDLKENQKRFDEALDTTMPIEKYFQQIDDCIYYSYNVKQPYTSNHTITIPTTWYL